MLFRSAEIYHEVLQHRWFMSERAGQDVGRVGAARNYVQTVLVAKPDERAIIAASQDESVDDTQEMRLVFPENTPEFEV